MSWPGDAMTFYGWGFVAGITRGREQADAEAEALFRRAVGIVQAHANGTPHIERMAAVKARQAASCEAQRQEAQPWPDEPTS